MKPSQDLFHLIKSMSRSEKRYFKVFAGKSADDQNYLKVFAAIEKMKEYDERALIKGLQSESLGRQLPVIKNYLYKLILKSLRNFKAEKSVDFQIKERLMNARLLIDRDLVGQAGKQLDKAAKLAVEQERFEYMSEIGVLRTNLLLHQGHDRLDGAMEELDKIFSDTQRYLDLLLTIETYRLYSLKLLILNRHVPYIRSDENRRSYERLGRDPLLQAPPPADSVRATLFYHQSKALISISLVDFEASFHHLDALVKTMEAHPWAIKHSPENYLNSLQNRISISVNIHEPSRTQELLAEMGEFQERNPKLKLPPRLVKALKLFGYRMELEILMKQGHLEQAALLVTQIRAFLSLNDFRINLNEEESITY